MPKLLLIMAAVLIAAAAAAAAVYWRSNKTPASTIAEQEEMQEIVRGVFAADRLWLLHLDHTLASLEPDGAKPKPVQVPGKIVDICKLAGRLLILAEEDRKAGWTLHERVSDGWSIRHSVPAEGDLLVALACERDRVTLVTSRRIIEVEAGKTRSVRLTQELRPALVNATALAGADEVWVGFNVGEWGGGLTRILRRDGAVETVQSNRSGELCGGPLNTDCDPVNGIVAAPWNPSCIIAAIGLVHMMSHGRIVEVCGTDVRRLYFKALDPQPPYGTLDEGEPSGTVAFYGLARTGSAIWSIGIDGIYRFSSRQTPEFRPLPKFEDKGGYQISFDVPGMALVMTDVNGRAAMSGSVPIMAVR